MQKYQWQEKQKRTKYKGSQLKVQNILSPRKAPQ